MSSTVKPTKANALAGVQALITGTQKHLPNGTFTIGNESFTAASLTALLQSLVSAMTKDIDTKAAAKDARTELHDLKAQVGPVVKAYREILVGMYGSASQTLADFGLAPHKARAPMTVEKKAEAAAKRTATRAARGTKGPKQKLAIKGTAPAAPSATPATSPATPATAPAKPAG
jgi:hypothetical protein